MCDVIGDWIYSSFFHYFGTKKKDLVFVINSFIFPIQTEKSKQCPPPPHTYARASRNKMLNIMRVRVWMFEWVGGCWRLSYFNDAQNFQLSIYIVLYIFSTKCDRDTVIFVFISCLKHYQHNKIALTNARVHLKEKFYCCWWWLDGGGCSSTCVLFSINGPNHHHHSHIWKCASVPNTASVCVCHILIIKKWFEPIWLYKIKCI